MFSPGSDYSMQSNPHTSSCSSFPSHDPTHTRRISGFPTGWLGATTPQKPSHRGCLCFVDVLAGSS